MFPPVSGWVDNLHDADSTRGWPGWDPTKLPLRLCPWTQTPSSRRVSCLCAVLSVLNSVWLYFASFWEDLAAGSRTPGCRRLPVLPSCRLVSFLPRVSRGTGVAELCHVDWEGPTWGLLPALGSVGAYRFGKVLASSSAISVSLPSGPRVHVSARWVVPGPWRSRRFLGPLSLRAPFGFCCGLHGQWPFPATSCPPWAQGLVWVLSPPVTDALCTRVGRFWVPPATAPSRGPATALCWPALWLRRQCAFCCTGRCPAWTPGDRSFPGNHVSHVFLMTECVSGASRDRSGCALCHCSRDLCAEPCVCRPPAGRRLCSCARPLPHHSPSVPTSLACRGAGLEDHPS